MRLKVRKKRNQSGSVSIHIIDRTNRGYKVIESLGSSKDEQEIERLFKKALNRADELEHNLFYATKRNSKKELLKNLLSDFTTEDLIPIGDELIFGRLFDILGCSKLFIEHDFKNIRNLNSTH